MKSLTLRSYSKLNLYLKILGKYPDGYHRLYTLFHRLSLCDTLKLTKTRSGFTLKTSDRSLSTGEDNLITKAYRRLQKEIPGLGGVSVYLKKNIPIGAGLGGGSGNAAAFLLGMKRLYRLKISKTRLMEIGAGLGADVPFFVQEIKQGVGTGRGDRIKPLRFKSKLWFVLLASVKRLSTREVHQKLHQPAHVSQTAAISRQVVRLSRLLEKKLIHEAAALLQNDLENPAFSLRPSLKKLIQNLHHRGIPAARMSGSGPTVFTILSSVSEARGLARKLRLLEPELRLVVCHTL